MMAIKSIRLKSFLLSIAVFVVSGSFIGASQQGSVIDAVAQVIKPSKALLPGYSPQEVPAESGIYFQLVAEGYNARIKRDVLSKVRQSAAQGNSHAKELLYLFNQLSTTKTVKQVIALLTRGISAHKIMVTDNAAHQDIIAVNDRVYSALLLQSCVVLTNSARDQLLEVLEEINTSLIYWKDQKNHPVRYFFHKSPLKWLMGKDQADEIASNIKKLERLEHSIRSILGRMTHHLYNLNPNCSVDELYTWIEELISTLFCIGKYEDKDEHKTRFDKIAAQLRFKVSHVDNLTKTVFEKMAFAKKPSHYVRNWMAYTAAMIAVYKGYNYYGAYSEEIHKAMRASFGSMRGVVRESVVDPLKSVWSTITGTDVASEEGLNTLISDLNSRSTKLQELSKEIVLDVSKDIKTLEGVQHDAATDALKSFLNGLEIAQEQIDKVLSAAQQGDLGPLTDIVDAIKIPDLEWGFALPYNKEIVAAQAISKGAGKLAYYEQFVAHLTTFVREIAQLTDKVVVPSTKELIEVAADITKVVVVIVKEIEKILKQNRLTMQFVALIPVGGTLIGLNKLYSWATTKDYSAVRLALIEINSLFIEAKAPLGDADYGKLIYLLQGLKNKAIRYLPVKENLRDDFLADIAKLESQQFTVETKRRIIKNMFNKYPFLSFNTKSA